LVEGVSLAAFGDLDDYALNNDYGSLLAVAGGVAVDWHPTPASGWHVGGKIGVGYASLDVDPGPVASWYSGTDLMAALTGGYEWRLSRRWGLGLLLRAAYYSPVDFPGGYQVNITSNGGMTETPLDMRLSAFTYSVGFSAVF
jgi:hypothetical protein